MTRVPELMAADVNAAKVMHLKDCGLALGCDASFVLLQAWDKIEAIRSSANRLKVWKKGTRLAETPAALTALKVSGRPEVTGFFAACK